MSFVNGLGKSAGLQYVQIKIVSIHQKRLPTWKAVLAKIILLKSRKMDRDILQTGTREPEQKILNLLRKSRFVSLCSSCLKHKFIKSSQFDRRHTEKVKKSFKLHGFAHFVYIGGQNHIAFMI